MTSRADASKRRDGAGLTRLHPRRDFVMVLQSTKSDVNYLILWGMVKGWG